jgi:hypothetical protein
VIDTLEAGLLYGARGAVGIGVPGYAAGRLARFADASRGDNL